MRTVLFSVLLAVASIAVPTDAAAASTPTMPLGDVTVGARGECLTVLVGTKVEAVPFEVRGILPGYLGPKRDLIVIRLLGETAEFTGVAQGMSGSPCRLDGKVIGALSYSLLSFNKEPIAGVTPIDDMLAVLSLPTAALPWRQVAQGGQEPGGQPSATAPAAAGDSTAADALASKAAAPPNPSGAYGPGGPSRQLEQHDALDWRAALAGQASPVAVAGAGGLEPLGVPISVSGMDTSRQRFWQPYLASHGLHLHPGASDAAGATASQSPHQSNKGRNAAALPSRLEPGGSIAAVLVQGDINMAGTGTVSWVDGDDVLAFGHPFFGVGPISMPMANARIVQVLASLQLSRKLPVTGAVVGELTHDRLPGIRGKMGRAPSLVPVTGRIAMAGRRETFQFGLSRDGFWTPRFLLMALDAAISGRAEAGQHGTLHLTGTLTLDHHPPLTLHNVVAAGRNESLALLASAPLAQAFQQVWRTDLEEPPAHAHIEVEASFDETVEDEEILAVRLAGATVAPGDKLQVTVELGQPQGVAKEVALSLDVPAMLPYEQLRVVACDAEQADELEARLGRPQANDESGRMVAREPQLRREQRLAALGRRRVPGHLYVLLLADGGQTRRLGGESFTNLPPTVSVLLAGGPPSDARRGALIGQALDVPRPGVLRGRAEQVVFAPRPTSTLPAALFAGPF